MKHRLKILIIALSLIFSLSLISQKTFALEVPPAPQNSYILDSAQILSPEDETKLNQQISAIKNSTTNEVGILTLKDGENIDPAQFAVEVGRAWGIGSRQNKNGVLILITLQNPKYIQISTTTGLEGALTDAQAGQISRNEVAPQFRQEKYYEGLSLAISAIDSATKGEYQASDSSSSSKNFKTSDFIFGALFFGFIILQGLFALLAKTKSWWLGGVFGFFGGSLIGLGVHSLFFGIALNLILTPLGLFLDYTVSKNYKKHKKRKDRDSNYIFPWWFGGGGGFGSGSSGGGFGGFGGGGSFGGGGGGSSW
jgi:uncharacterized protein